MSGDLDMIQRRAMVDSQIRARGVRQEEVLAAMRKVERHRFVPAGLSRQAYEDHPLAIGFEQTISQPYIVARMTELLGLGEGDKVLEVGTGCGYQTAVLAEIAREVYSLEIVGELAAAATERLQELGYRNVFIRKGNGFDGWNKFAPYDAILVTAAPVNVPPVLVNQLRIGGKMVIPLGEEVQDLFLLTKKQSGVVTERIFSVRFVPMVQE